MNYFGTLYLEFLHIDSFTLQIITKEYAKEIFIEFSSKQLTKKCNQAIKIQNDLHLNHEFTKLKLGNEVNKHNNVLNFNASESKKHAGSKNTHKRCSSQANKRNDRNRK